MDEKKPKLFFSLERILKRTNLSEKNLPVDLSQWQEFIDRINNTFYDFEQERYLLERSMDISSREMLELNERFEVAQKIAHIGYWFYNPMEDKILWTKETYRIFGLDPSLGTPNFENAMKMIHKKDRDSLSQLIDRALTEGKDYEAEVRIQNALDKKIYWVYVKGHPYIDKKLQASNGKSGYCLSGTIMDITSRKLDEQREILRLKLMNVLAENSSLNAAAPELLKIICETLNLEIGELWAVDKASNVLRNAAIWFGDNTSLQEFVDISKQITFSPGVGLPGRVWLEKKMCWIDDVVNNPNFPRAVSAKKANLHTAFALPIIFEEKVLGVLDFLSHRTYSLDNEIMYFLNDINKQIGIFIAREQTQKRIEILSRQAGMSQIATSVLHNIGNTLTSLNVSISLLQELVDKSEIKKLSQVSQLIDDNLSQISNYFHSDEKGKLIPKYLHFLSENLIKEYQQIDNEIDDLIKNTQYIKDIVIMQNAISGISSVKESIFLPEVMDLAIQMSFATPEISATKLIKNYEYPAYVLIDKTKLLQILVNLIMNARESLSADKENHQKTLTLSIKKSKAKPFIELIVQDNGLGISKVNLNKIFTMGFTTKPTGHGFGLHSSAITAKELGGSLDAESEGKGASFTVRLPVTEELDDEPRR